MDAMQELAQFAYEMKFEDIPQQVIDHEKLLLLDTLGVALAGSAAPGCREVVELMREYGGRPQSSFLVFGGKALANHAAMANATMIQALDFDDNHDEACCHAHCSCLPPALAMAEYMGGKTGKDILEALILALEVQCRIGMGITSTIAFVRTGTLGFFGATVAAAKMLGLSFPQFVDALGPRRCSPILTALWSSACIPPSECMQASFPVSWPRKGSPVPEACWKDVSAT